MNRMIRLAVGLVAAASLAVAASAAPPAAPPVSVRVEQATFSLPSTQPPSSRTCTTDVITLENEFLKATVLPTPGLRVLHVIHKATGRDLLWSERGLEATRGGAAFEFPVPQFGMPPGETSWRTVQGPDGSVTVAMDRRFTQNVGDPRKVHDFSALRLAVYVTLRPGSSVLEYTARVDNRLPLPHGLQLWNVARFPRQNKSKVLFPVSSVIFGNPPAAHRWPAWDGEDHSVIGSGRTDGFGLDMQGDWVGLYYPDADANHLILKPRYTALGTRLSVTRNDSPKAPGSPDDDVVAVWNGSKPTFDHPGHYLPPFGTYVMPLKLTMVTGIGPVDWANSAVAVSYLPAATAAGGRIRIVGFDVRPGCSIMARTKQETVQAAGTLRPDEPIEIVLSKPTDAVLLTVRDGDDNELAEVRLPWKAERTAEDALKTLQGEMHPEGWLAAELADEVSGEGGMAAAARRLAETAPTDAETAVHAARLVLRTQPPASGPWTAARDRLRRLAVAKDASRYVHAYLGMMLALEAGGKVTPQAAGEWAKAAPLPAVRYLLALEAVGAGNPAAASSLFKRSAAEAPPVMMGLGENALQGNDRLHPAATVGGQWPALVRAAVLIALKQPDSAIAALQRLLVDDPARPEALALLAEAFTQINRLGDAQKAQAEAEGLFRMNDGARRDLEAIRREAKEGVWSGIPRP